jgi:hypothetical protein
MTMPVREKAEAAKAEAQRTGKRVLIKHGDHDQSSHGNWASGESEPAGQMPEGFADHTPDMDTPEWDDVRAEIADQGQGNCYQAANTLLLAAEELGLRNPVVVQATVMGQGELEGVRFGHSWLEADAQSMTDPQGNEVTFRNAYDFASGNAHVMPDALYRHIGQVENVHEYDADEAMAKMLETRNYGPWTDDLLGFA